MRHRLCVHFSIDVHSVALHVVRFGPWPVLVAKQHPSCLRWDVDHCRRFRCI